MNKIKVCKIHGETSHSHVPSENRWRCTRCNTEAVAKRRRKLIEKAKEYLGGKCSKCGYNKCRQALEFHHVDPSQKEFGISASGITRSWERIKEELKKCILVCANCHREIHNEKE